MSGVWEIAGLVNDNQNAKCADRTKLYVCGNLSFTREITALTVEYRFPFLCVVGAGQRQDTVDGGRRVQFRFGHPPIDRQLEQTADIARRLGSCRIVVRVADAEHKKKVFGVKRLNELSGISRQSQHKRKTIYGQRQ